jgi:restriction system protein
MIKEIKDKINQLITLKNNETNEIVRSYNEWAISGIEGWVENLLKNLYFDTIQNVKFDLLYDIEWKNLILEYYFPSLEKLPTYKDESKTGKILRHSDAAMKKLYDKYISSLCIRLLYEIYNNDSKNYIDWIVFNWIVTSIDKSNWHERTDCILSVSSEKKDIKNIVLENIDPKETIKSLHWICATSLSSLTPVAPISTINKNDKRFVEWYNVIDSLNDSVNIACMDWQDFENLIRDLFEKIYWEKWWEVKITQASRDWWVDAIAFDPDPVTWWKILIQAKRYTNVVWVWAVRDLAWAVHHEWAMKWILVTTSNFWHDAMKFVAKEPISLINWQNLLSLLNKYWYHAHIDIKEARKILKEQEKK